MAVIRDKNTGEPIAWTSDDPIAKREGPSPTPYPGEAGSTMIRSSELTAAQNLDQAEMGMTPTQAPDTGSSNTTTIQDDYGNTITFDKDNPNPEASAAYSTSSYGNEPPVSPDPNYQNSAAASDAGNLGSSTSSGISMRDSNTMDATNTYGSAAEVAGAGSDIGNLGSSVNSSLGGITDTGKMFSSATESASSAASGELSSVLNSVPGGSLTGVLGSIPGLGSMVGPLAAAGNIMKLTSTLTKGLSATGIQGLATGIAIGNIAKLTQSAGGMVSNFVSVGSKIGDAQGFAKTLATNAAALHDQGSTVSVNGKIVSVPQPPRPNDILLKAQGNTQTVIPPEARSAAANVQNAMRICGTSENNDTQDEGTARSPGMPVNGIPKQYGAIRDGRAIVPSMEALMFDVAPSAIGKFTSLLPPVFKSLLPLGVVSGLVSKGPISLGGLTQLVGGAALGAVAGQALRSVGAGNISAVSGVTGMLGAQALARTVGSGAIPVNIASTYGGMMLGAVGGKALGNVAGKLSSNVLGTDPSTTAMISNVVGIVGTLSLTKNLTGIPVSSQVLGLAANVALRSAGVPTGIPTGVLGMAAGLTSSPLASIVGSLVSGRVPVIPTNLSIGNIGALSGLTQNLQSFGLAENIIPRSQLNGLLPPNLGNQINAYVPPRMRGTPGFNNEIEDKNRAASTRTSSAELQPRTGTDVNAKPPMHTGEYSGSIPYGQKISKYYTLADLSNAAIFKHNIVAQNGLTIPQIIAGLSWIATNLLDPIRDAGYNFTVNSGFRGPGGSNPTGDHGRGAAVDIQFGNDRKKHHAMANWIRQTGLPAGLVILEKPGSANWLHLAGGTGHPTARFPKTAYADQTWYGGDYLAGFLPA